jgi:hypothetical protein
MFGDKNPITKFVKKMLITKLFPPNLPIGTDKTAFLADVSNSITFVQNSNWYEDSYPHLGLAASRQTLYREGSIRISGQYPKSLQ